MLRRKRTWVLMAVAAAAAVAFAAPAMAAESLRIPDDLASPRGFLYVTGVLTALAMVPLILVSLSSFTRIVVVLSFLRNAVATPQIPPNPVIIALALFLTAATMAPTWERVYSEAVRPYLAGEIGAAEAVARGEAPLREFMLRHTRESTLKMFLDYLDVKPETPQDTPMRALVPAFMVSELRTAFEMGFMLYLPFLVIDLAVGTALMSFGMIMLPPVMVSLPLKLLVFVLADGWDAVVSSLLASYH
ncbi:flagellar biosynthetic protein FliP [Thermanaeromonas toyohensis ToBE]|uniref:Flagellar biosynthetic protein FliP n=1 Tax=Thermanaeromonas toyohensis ToBE TaxID=698762 RepID=A0A1W1VTC9_9FIRM|nr:flagellar type III secretion system pore protein FliP [Thermanaeromonas toyohensis]SMB96635.1 flagellar biosynthetic protein FliP [Thermanaeromonas toyohensis ToBE]